jgi:c-di-GMP-binding flagellar brake protein YcgR
VLSLPSAGMLRHCKSRFLGHAPEGFWVESAADQGPLIQELLARGGACGVSFKSGTVKVICAAPLLRRDERYRVNAQTTLEALLLAYPQQLQSVQRRATYRVQVAPERDDLAVRLWRIGRQAAIEDMPPESQHMPVRLRDISTGGIGVMLLGAIRLGSEERLRIELAAAGRTLLLEGRLRYLAEAATEPNVAAGIAFWNLSQDLTGRRALAQLHRLVGDMQRREIRRLRLGMTMAG